MGAPYKNTPDDVAERISFELKTTSNPNVRFFTMISRTGSVRMLKPNTENPKILHFETPGADIAANLLTHAESIVVLGKVLQSRVKPYFGG